MQLLGKKIIYIDGYCVLCNNAALYVLTRDYKNQFFFATLQGDYAQSNIPKQYLINGHYNTVYLQSDAQILEKSDAVIAILKHLGFSQRIVALFLGLIPLFLRNLAYNFVAKHRYKLFGKQQVCSLELQERYKSRILL